MTGNYAPYIMHEHVEIGSRPAASRPASAAAVLANIRTMELSDQQAALDARVQDLETATAHSGIGQRLTGAGLERYRRALAVGIDEQSARSLGLATSRGTSRPTGSAAETFQVASGRPIVYYPGERRSWRDLN
ncbi:hypothetical protein ACLQ2Q_20725 [Microbacterium sp. DT81.1]|uniref:hypothetical protein n=1 Tax=Microbacterium sp. DT81.1 TaxID=3393413 RepID=UPI003CEF237F